jgi:hypothetical protein
VLHDWLEFSRPEYNATTKIFLYFLNPANKGGIVA